MPREQFAQMSEKLREYRILRGELAKRLALALPEKNRTIE